MGESGTECVSIAACERRLEKPEIRVRAGFPERWFDSRNTSPSPEHITVTGTHHPHRSTSPTPEHTTAIAEYITVTGAHHRHRNTSPPSEYITVIRIHRNIGHRNTSLSPDRNTSPCLPLSQLSSHPDHQICCCYCFFRIYKRV